MKNKPAILLLVDKKGWAYDAWADAFIKYLSGDFNFIVRYVSENPDLGKDVFDLIYVFFWGANHHLNYISDPKRIIKCVSSHRWENEPRWGCLTPDAMVKKYLSDAGYLTASSIRLQKIISPYRDIAYCPTGVETGIFKDKNRRKGNIKIGWAGNEKDQCKGLYDILMPACGKRITLQIAGGDLTQDQMVDFYNSIDVFAVASTAEGEPRTLLEAMACGCFPVAVEVGIVPELVKNSYNGLIVKREVRDFENAFIWCEQNLEIVRRAGTINAQTISQNRSWEEMAHHYGKVFQRALLENKSPVDVKSNGIIEK